MFESSVNSYGGQTVDEPAIRRGKFESSVNSYGGQTLAILFLIK